MPLAFAFLGVAVLFVVSGLKGGTIADAFGGKLNTPLDPKGGDAASSPLSSLLSQLGSEGSDTGTPSSADPSLGTTLKGSKQGSPVTAGTSVGGLHLTLGLPGYPAHDYFAPSGSPAVSPVDGVVTKLSGHDPAAGPTMGPHGPFGWSVYIKGDNGHSYFLTHLGTRNVSVGTHLKQGQQIGTVGNYARYGTPSHIHMGVMP